MREKPEKQKTVLGCKSAAELTEIHLKENPPKKFPSGPSQGNRIKKEEARAKSAKNAKDSEGGLIESVDQPINIPFEQVSSEIDEQPEFKLGKPQIGQYLLAMHTGKCLNGF